jgi:hypothetical protein
MHILNPFDPWASGKEAPAELPLAALNFGKLGYLAIVHPEPISQAHTHHIRRPYLHG